jgi:hypothetical protein
VSSYHKVELADKQEELREAIKERKAYELLNEKNKQAAQQQEFESSAKPNGQGSTKTDHAKQDYANDNNKNGKDDGNKQQQQTKTKQEYQEYEIKLGDTLSEIIENENKKGSKITQKELLDANPHIINPKLPDFTYVT